jgi:hypothetical protein
MSMENKIAASFPVLNYRGSGYLGIIKNLPKEASAFLFTGLTVTYRFPYGLALAPLRKHKGCRAGHRASSLAAALDSFKTYSFIKQQQ